MCDNSRNLLLHLHDSFHHGQLCRGCLLLVLRQVLLNKLKLLLENSILCHKGSAVLRDVLSERGAIHQRVCQLGDLLHEEERLVHIRGILGNLV